MTIEIEKGIPMPTRSRNSLEIAEAINKLEIADSFICPAKQRGNISYLFANCATRKFVTRKVDENHIRVWRVE